MDRISEKTKGILFMIFASLAFSTMGMVARLAVGVSSMQKTFFRNVISVIVMLLVLKKQKKPLRLKKGTLVSHLLRSAFGTIGVVGFFFATERMKLSDATMLTELSPFFTIIFSALLLREKANAKQWLLIGMALVGAAFVIKPTNGIFSNVGALVALFTSVCAGMAYTMVRKLGNDGEDSTVIILFFSLFSCIVTLPFSLRGLFSIGVRELLILLATAALGCCGQFGITLAYRHAPASEISIFDYFQILFSALFGFLIFRELPDGWSLVGYGIILAAAVLMFRLGKNR